VSAGDGEGGDGVSDVVQESRCVDVVDETVAAAGRTTNADVVTTG